MRLFVMIMEEKVGWLKRNLKSAILNLFKDNEINFLLNIISHAV